MFYLSTCCPVQSELSLLLLLLLLLLLQGHLCGPGALLPGTTNTPSPSGVLCNTLFNLAAVLSLLT
jgi:hypothetical protein